MIILQFCWQDDHNDILSFPADRIIYTGTHDNHTTLGWFLSNHIEEKPDNQFMENYLFKVGMLSQTDKLSQSNVSKLMMELAYASPCHIAIVPMQDILGLDDRARMNIPGVALGNWHWRIAHALDIFGIKSDWLKLLQEHNRLS
jgi:4-alpha-glucanotransferase